MACHIIPSLPTHDSQSFPPTVGAISAMYLGDERQRTVEVYVDGVLVTTWTSSGTTLDFESIDLSGSSGQDITITGVLVDSEWLSITEVCSPRSSLFSIR